MLLGCYFSFNTLKSSLILINTSLLFGAIYGLNAHANPFVTLIPSYDAIFMTLDFLQGGYWSYYASLIFVFALIAGVGLWLKIHKYHRVMPA